MIKKILLGTLGLFLLLVILAYLLINSKQPQRSGELKLDGLKEIVEVNYDEFGIPHIYAKNDSDLYRAFGYIHAQDRLFQMELLRRLGNGQMAEIFGEQLIPVDKLYRTLGIAKHSKHWIANMRNRSDSKIFRAAESYLAGINQFVKQGNQPIEFDLLGINAKEFTIEDIASVMGFTSFSFAQALHDDPLLYLLSKKLNAQQLKDLGVLYTDGFPKLPVSKNLLKSVINETASVIQQLQPAGLFHGSNSWLLSPSRTESGQAMFVNDPHIAFSQPAVWYEAQLHSDTTNIYGHFIGLIPFPLLGFNEELAWGLTMFENDDMDLYLEKVNPDNNEQYWAIDHWQNFEQVDEVIKVKDYADIMFKVKKTRHGPVINSILEHSTGKPAAEIEQPLAMWWSFLDIENQQMEAFYELPFANTVEKAAAAAEKIHSPGLNLMYANAKGDIAWWATAKLPIRPSHVNSKYILDGASGEDDILGFYDFSHNPKNINPKSGMIYTANNQPEDMGDGLIPGYYSPKDRPERIVKLLSEKEKFNVADMQRILLDNTTPAALLFKKIAIQVLDKNKDELTDFEISVRDILSQWKGNHDPKEIAATVYTRFRIRLMQLTMEDEIGTELFEKFQHGFLMDRSIWRIVPNKNSLWWDNINTEETETREQLVLQAWKESIRFLKKRLGNDVNNWQWQNDVKMVHEHPLGNLKPLDKIFNVGPLPSRSGVEAINNLMFISDGDNLKIMMGPSTRRVIDFADVNNSWGINPTGQSGVPMDKHYSDQAQDYADGKFRRQYLSKQDVEANSEGKLLLLP